MTDGPTSGWNRSATQGAAVSIWGVNFGVSRGTSTVTVCGVTLNSDSDFAEWGATTNPQTARGLQRITFWLKSGMTTGAGTIQVATAGGTSGAIPFYCRALGANHIYFESRLDGNDSYDGLSDHHTTGNHGPWLTIYNASTQHSNIRNTMVAGDVAYFRGNGTAVWNEIDGDNTLLYFCQAPSGQPVCSSGQEHNNGTANDSISLAAYPAEMAQLGDSSVGNIFRHNFNDVLKYWTFSKFKTRSINDTTYWAVGNSSTTDDHLRFIGMDMSTYGDSSVISLAGGALGETNLSIYGNYMHDAGAAGSPGSIPPTRCYGLYLGGYGWQQHIDVGWNEIAHQAHGRGIQIYGHTTTDWMDDLKIHDNFIHENAMTGAVLGGGDANTGTDGTYGIAYSFVRNLYFYNNIVSSNGYHLNPGDGDYPGLQIDVAGWGNGPGNYYLYNNVTYLNANNELDIYGSLVQSGSTGLLSLQNNIIYSTNLGYYSRGANAGTLCTVCATSGHNLYFGAGNTLPSWDNGSLVQDPKFVNATPVAYGDFYLQPNSPAVNAGTSGVSSIVNRDFLGIPRPQGSGYDMGVFEYVAGGQILAVPPVPPRGFRLQ